MPKVIKSVTSARNVYPWREWADGKSRKMTRGRDFEIEASRFRHSVYTAARRMGLKAKVSVKGDSIEFQFVKPPAKGKASKSKVKSRSHKTRRSK